MKINVRKVSIIIVAALLSAIHAIAQQTGNPKFGDKLFYEKQGGNFSLGTRNTISLFNDGRKGSVGTGMGGHFRLQIVNRVNTEWFADVFMSNIENKVHRTDYHIGWSVMYYLINPNGFEKKFTPYMVSGHCFDQTVFKINGESGVRKARTTSEVQTGLGVHYNITPVFDFSFTTQFGFHLGKEMELVNNEDGTMSVEKLNNADWQGHLMFSISANYKIHKLWNRK